MGCGREARRGLPPGGADDAGLARQPRGGDQGRGDLPGRGPSEDESPRRVLETILSVRLGKYIMVSMLWVVFACVVKLAGRCVLLCFRHQVWPVAREASVGCVQRGLG